MQDRLRDFDDVEKDTETAREITSLFTDYGKLKERNIDKYVVLWVSES